MNGLKEAGVVLFGFTGIGFALGICLSCGGGLTKTESGLMKAMAECAMLLEAGEKRDESVKNVVRCALSHPKYLKSMEEKGTEK